jgi:hypothetical protein
LAVAASLAAKVGLHSTGTSVGGSATVAAALAAPRVVWRLAGLSAGAVEAEGCLRLLLREAAAAAALRVDILYLASGDGLY